jgi:alpha-glucosidase
MKVAAFVLLASCGFAQDERRITSPNGQIEFRLFIATQESNNLPRLAYEVFYKNQPLIKTSFMGLDIEVQEPLLGENVGLTSSSTAKTEKYNSLIAHYMQNGSLGRLIDVEARAYNDGVAFRYIIPPSTPLTEFIIDEEATEFHFAAKLDVGPWVDGGPEFGYNTEFSPGKPNTFVMLRLSSTWVGISESLPKNYPRMRLIRTNPTTDLTRLDHKFEQTTPLTCPWRIISIASTYKAVLQSTVATDLNR